MNVAPNPEAALLLRLAAAHLFPKRLSAVSEVLGADVNWPRFTRYALRHSVAPHVGAGLGALNSDAVPKVVSDGFAAVAAANRLHNLRLASELVIATKALAAAGIGTLSLKGPALAQQVDGSLASRVMMDIDLLVHAGQGDAARRLLLERGYQILLDHSVTGKDDVLVRPGDGMTIDLHRSLDASSLTLRLPLGSLIDAPGTAKLFGINFSVLPLHENIVYLAYHGAKHGWERLSWLVDIVGLIERQRSAIVPSRLAALARSSGAARAVASAITLAQQWLETDISDIAPSLQSHRAAGRLSRAATRLAFAERPAGEAENPGVLLRLAVAALAPGGKDAATAAGLKSALRLPTDPQAISVAVRHARLGGSAAHYLARFTLRPSGDDVRALGRPANRRFFWAVVRPIRLSLRIVSRLIGRKPGR